jgi:hypothetical protein
MIKRFALALGASVFAVALIGCGERPQVVKYSKSGGSEGNYAGKPDAKPYAGAPWNGNEQQWATNIRTRNQAQNEYKRTN